MQNYNDNKNEKTYSPLLRLIFEQREVTSAEKMKLEVSCVWGLSLKNVVRVRVPRNRKINSRSINLEFVVSTGRQSRRFSSVFVVLV